MDGKWTESGRKVDGKWTEDLDGNSVQEKTLGRRRRPRQNLRTACLRPLSVHFPSAFRPVSVRFPSGFRPWSSESSYYLFACIFVCALWFVGVFQVRRPLSTRSPSTFRPHSIRRPLKFRYSRLNDTSRHLVFLFCFLGSHPLFLTPRNIC